MNQGATILIVDDEALVRDVVALLVQRAGYRVLSAGSAVEALELVRTSDEPVALAILDLVMPEGGGVRLLSRLRDLQPHLSPLFMSGYNPPLGLPDGAPLLMKPFSAADLLRAIDA